LRKHQADENVGVDQVLAHLAILVEFLAAKRFGRRNWDGSVMSIDPIVELALPFFDS